METCMKPRTYDIEFKRQAVELCNQSGKAVAEIARDLGIRANLLYRWKQQILTPANQDAKDREIAQLRRALRDSQETNDILKKAVAIFSSEAPQR